MSDLAIGGVRTLVSSPQVVTAVRNFFDCASMEGAEVEDDLGSGSAGSHWDQRLFEVHWHSTI